MPKLEIVNHDNQPLLGDGPTVKSQGKVVFSGKKKVDVKFVFDTTGSMDDKILALVKTVSNFVDESASVALDLAYGLVSFGDLTVRGDRIVVEISGEIDPTRVIQALNRMNRNGGGGNEGESSFEAIMKAMESNWRPGAIKVMVVITDEPALFDRYQPESILSILKASEVMCFVLSPNLPYYRRIAKENAGEWAPISATSSLQMLKDLFAKLARDIMAAASEFARLKDGDMSKFKQLKSGKD